MAPPSTTAEKPAEKREQSAALSAVTYGVGVAIIAVAAARLLKTPQLLHYGLAAAVAVALVGGVIGALVQRRTRPVRHLHAALLKAFGPDLARDAIKLHKFRSGLPTKVVITYPASFNEREEKARKEIRDIIGTRLGGRADASWDPVKRRLVVLIDPDSTTSLIRDSDTAGTDVADDKVTQAATRERATGVIQNVLGAAAKVDVVFDDDAPDGEQLPVAVTVKYPATRHDVSPRFRQAVLTQVDEKIDNKTGAWRDHWDLKNNVVTFEPRPPFPKNAPFPLDRPIEKGTLIYAVNERNTVQGWKLGSKHPHHLIVGPTGSGKTVLIRNLAISAAMQGIPVILCDPKRIEYRELAGFPGILLVTSIEDISYAIIKASELMGERYNLIEAGIVEEGEFDKILVIVDEFIIFKDLANKAWRAGFDCGADDKPKPRKGDDPSISQLSNMGYLARSADVHLVIGMQRPDADILSGPLRDQLRKRTALDQHSTETAKMMWGDGRKGTNLPSIQGRGLSETGRGPEEVQVLRCLPPGTKGHTEADAVMWEEVKRRAHNPDVWKDVELPDFFEELEQRRLRTIRQIRERYKAKQPELPSVSLDKPALEAPQEADEVDTPDQSTSAAPEPQSTLDQVSPYDLAAGDTIMIEDETGIPEIVEIADIHFGNEDEDDEEESIVVDYVSTETGVKGTVYLDPDEDVDRCG